MRSTLNRCTNAEIAEVCEIADLLISPYWQEIAEKEKENQLEFYNFAGKQALQLLKSMQPTPRHDLFDLVPDPIPILVRHIRKRIVDDGLPGNPAKDRVQFVINELLLDLSLD